METKQKCSLKLCSHFGMILESWTHGTGPKQLRKSMKCELDVGAAAQATDYAI